MYNFFAIDNWVNIIVCQAIALPLLCLSVLLSAMESHWEQSDHACHKSWSISGYWAIEAKTRMCSLWALVVTLPTGTMPAYLDIKCVPVCMHVHGDSDSERAGFERRYCLWMVNAWRKVMLSLASKMLLQWALAREEVGWARDFFATAKTIIM